jgi:thiopurine S-methyltransferase
VGGACVLARDCVTCAQLYAKTITDVVVPGGRILLSVFKYDQSASAGPPFCVTGDDVKALFGEHFDIELIDSTSTSVGGGQVPAQQQVYTLTKRA